MTKSFLIRAKPSLISAIDARAAQLGQDRSKYIMTLVERDMSKAEAEKPRKHKFACDDLIGAYSTGTGLATNANIRRIISKRLKERYGRNLR